MGGIGGHCWNPLDLGLLPEFRRSTTYWLFHDNCLT